MKDVLKALHERPIAYYPIYKKVTGSTTAGILLSQLMYWWAKVDGRLFYKTDADIYEETALTERELKTAKAHLRQFDFVRIFLAGNPARTHYEIFEDRLIDAIRQTSLDESAKQDRTKQPNKAGRNGLTLIQENTQKTKTVESTPAEFLVTTIALETISSVEGEVPRPADPDWMQVAKDMEAYAKGDGAAQWRFMCEAQGYKGEVLPIVSNWASKAGKYQLMNWKSEFRKLQTWLKTESRADYKAAQRSGTPAPATSAPIQIRREI